MIRPAHATAIDGQRLATALLLPVLVFLLAVLPPETRGESMAGCAVLALLAVALVPGRLLDLRAAAGR